MRKLCKASVGELAVDVPSRSADQCGIDVLDVVVLVELGEELLDLGAGGRVGELDRVLRPPAEAHRRDRPAERR